MSMLFNGDNSDSDGELKINAEYANIYDNFRQKEELHKLKARYGEDAASSEDESSSDDSSDDEDINNSEFDNQFLMALAYLKSDDPSKFDEKVQFFNNTDKPGTSESAEAGGKEKKRSKKEKPLFLRDYERKIILERDGRFSSSEDEDDARQDAKSRMPTYVQEQKELKDSFKCALKDDDEDDNDLLKIKQKTEDEKHKEEKSYKEWLKGQEVEMDCKEKEMLKPLRDFWSNPNLDSNEKFLRDYILNNKYMDNESYGGDLEYNHVIHDSDENLSEDERTIQKQEEFEHKYNFRFEEPDQEFIKRYPRTMENSMRKKDTHRAQKRATVKQRKEEEKQQKREDLKQLKALKRKEIEEKIEKLKEITGNDDMRFDSVDFDSDFDPNEHDRKMREIFNDEYYTGGQDEMQKPEFPEIDEELDIESKWDTYDPTTDKIESTPYDEPHCEDPDFNMDAEYDGSRNLQTELIENTKKKKRRRRSKFAELITKEKPKFDPKQFPSYADYFDQYYSLDYEDLIGDMPCRFKYRKVVPNDYGLSVEEILTADDKELNKWCPLRQALKHKPEHVEKNEIRIYKEKAMNEARKRKILKSLYTEPEEKEEEEKDKLVNEQIETSNKKRRRKKKTKANDPNVESTNTDVVSKEESMYTTKDGVQNNLHNDDDRKEDVKNKDAQEQNTINMSKKRKRKNKLKKADSDDPISKKMKTDNAIKKDSQMKAAGNNIKIENNNEKVVAIKKSAGQKKNKNRSSQFNQTNTGKRKQDYDDPILSLNAERLKTYGINAKKLKNKLKYSHKKL
ncbi:PREDICTED: protein KRI1 homolog [Vollenhovia emeryi]|uniref:protein KRI1 homolog n=1 Tax=Vollenhovia emeryi TaxID=411798 RepID=UPI0005F40BAE|nr:PREDICTED: protein KRI1 homolog [Vollenhovia emeryi]